MRCHYGTKAYRQYCHGTNATLIHLTTFVGPGFGWPRGQLVG